MAIDQVAAPESLEAAHEKERADKPKIDLETCRILEFADEEIAALQGEIVALQDQLDTTEEQLTFLSEKNIELRRVVEEARTLVNGIAAPHLVKFPFVRMQFLRRLKDALKN